ncbi:hypothetical protein ACETU7_36475 [Rhodococcus sp. 3Y1]
MALGPRPNPRNGRVDAKVNPNKQPRTGCTLLDAASSANRVSVLESAAPVKPPTG